MKSFKSLGSIPFKGGVIHTVELDKYLENRDDVGRHIGKRVLIDGQEYKVKGVESFARAMLYKGEKIGIWVESDRSAPNLPDLDSGVSKVRLEPICQIWALF